MSAKINSSLTFNALLTPLLIFTKEIFAGQCLQIIGIGVSCETYHFLTNCKLLPLVINSTFIKLYFPYLS